MAYNTTCPKGHNYVAADVYRDWLEGMPRCPICRKEWLKMWNEPTAEGGVIWLPQIDTGADGMIVTDEYCSRCSKAVVTAKVGEIAGQDVHICAACIDELLPAFHRTVPESWPEIDSGWCDKCGNQREQVVVAMVIAGYEYNEDALLCEPCLLQLRQEFEPVA